MTAGAARSTPPSSQTLLDCSPACPGMTTLNHPKPHTLILRWPAQVRVLASSCRAALRATDLVAPALVLGHLAGGLDAGRGAAQSLSPPPTQLQATQVESVLGLVTAGQGPARWQRTCLGDSALPGGLPGQLVELQQALQRVCQAVCGLQGAHELRSARLASAQYLDAQQSDWSGFWV